MKSALFIISILLCSVLYGQSFQRADLDQYFDALEKNDKFMGTAAVSVNGRLLYSRSVGFAEADRQIKKTTATKYRTGSVSKMYTAVLTLQAIEENRLTLNTRLSEFFAEIKNSEKITVEHLLRHRSGIHDFTDSPAFAFYYRSPNSSKHIIERIEEAGSDFEPGTKMSYSNSNYSLLTYILEQIYSKTYSELLSQKITGPLKLENTFLGSKINIENGEAFSYRMLSEPFKMPETDMSVPTGAGAIVSTSEDLLKFIEQLLQGDLLSEGSLQKMKTMKEGYGLGIFAVKHDESEGFGHNGSIDGFQSELFYFPTTEISVTILSNGSAVPVKNIRNTVLDAVSGKAIKHPDFEGVKVPQEILERYSGVYSAPDFPLKINISNRNAKLYGQATGQGEFELTATSERVFTFESADITISFSENGDEMTLNQYGRVTGFKKEK